jgi:hypothetical protein
VLFRSIGFAEEPKCYSDKEAMQGSFTETRATLIQEIFKKKVPSEDEFIKKVEQIFELYKINPQEPYLQEYDKNE